MELPTGSGAASYLVSPQSRKQDARRAAWCSTYNGSSHYTFLFTAHKEQYLIGVLANILGHIAV
jgi:hypothetical protein